MHRDYSRGIGLHATLDVRCLKVDAVNGFIDRFLAIEADYRDPVPRSWRYEQVPCWGIESNALVEPWGWAEAEANAGQPAPSH
ncbi:hypothetical protein DID96_18405 [Burkholderia sp. Bp8963]|nr:hypothetical protein DID96_18405 [Burkholderia sp. Bp8963]